MPARRITVTLVYPLLDPFQDVVLELPHFPATDAHQVVVMSMLEGVLVVPPPIRGARFPGYPGVSEELDRPEDGGLTDTGIYAPGGV